MKKAIPVLINFMRIFLILSLFVSCIGKNPDKAKDSLVPETEIIYSEKPVSVVTFESPASKTVRINSLLKLMIIHKNRILI